MKINENKRPNLIKGGKEINASGMFVLPGFIDMHAHIGGISQGADWDYVFNLWLAHGGQLLEKLVAEVEIGLLI